MTSENHARRVFSSLPSTLDFMSRKAKEPSLVESFRESFESPTFILSSIVVVVASLRFLFDGATAELMGQTLTFAHTDPAAYAALLTPVLGAHSYIRAKAAKPIQKVDPDARQS